MNEYSVTLPKSWLTVISGSTATSATTVQKQTQSAIDLTRYLGAPCEDHTLLRIFHLSPEVFNTCQVSSP